VDRFLSGLLPVLPLRVSILRPGLAVLRIVQGVGRLRPGSPRRSAGRCAFGWLVVSAGAAGP
jgi:hypothetical protein